MLHLQGLQQIPGCDQHRREKGSRWQPGRCRGVLQILLRQKLRSQRIRVRSRGWDAQYGCRYQRLGEEQCTTAVQLSHHHCQQLRSRTQVSTLRRLRVPCGGDGGWRTELASKLLQVSRVLKMAGFHHGAGQRGGNLLQSLLRQVLCPERIRFRHWSGVIRLHWIDLLLWTALWRRRKLPKVGNSFAPCNVCVTSELTSYSLIHKQNINTVNIIHLQ